MEERAMKERCRDCAYLYEGENGVWMCDDWETSCRYVSEYDCPIDSCKISDVTFEKLFDD